MTASSDSEDVDLVAALRALEAEAEQHLRRVRNWDVAPNVTPDTIRAHLQSRYAFESACSSDDLLRDVTSMLRRWSLHCTHPRHFGLFNPPALPITAPADAAVAIFNPQVGTWGHSPIANEIERHVLDYLGDRIGFARDELAAHFTSGGQEANTTAVAVALGDRFPSVVTDGLRSLERAPRLYISADAHHSLLRAARLLGLGLDAVREIQTTDKGVISFDHLALAVREDRDRGHEPFLVVATAGTTGMGAIDPLEALADFCEREELWLHADAAWGGSALLSDHLREHFKGIERVDSVTWDAHKWLSVPMGAGMYFGRHRAAMTRVFGITTGYVPDGRGDVDEPYMMTAQWSRRFIGLKVFMALAKLSRDGLAQLIEHQAAMGDTLRSMLADAGWTIVNSTPLPVVCFTHSHLREHDAAIEELVDRIQHRGRAWVSHLTTKTGESVIRACITSFDTNPDDLSVLMDELSTALDAVDAVE